MDPTPLQPRRSPAAVSRTPRRRCQARGLGRVSRSSRALRRGWSLTIPADSLEQPVSNGGVEQCPENRGQIRRTQISPPVLDQFLQNPRFIQRIGCGEQGFDHRIGLLDILKRLFGELPQVSKGVDRILDKPRGQAYGGQCGWRVCFKRFFRRPGALARLARRRWRPTARCRHPGRPRTTFHDRHLPFPQLLSPSYGWRRPGVLGCPPNGEGRIWGSDQC